MTSFHVLLPFFVKSGIKNGRSVPFFHSNCTISGRIFSNANASGRKTGARRRRRQANEKGDSPIGESPSVIPGKAPAFLPDVIVPDVYYPFCFLA